MVTLVQADLEFILKQIIIAEKHAAGGDLRVLVGNPLLPSGLRTVDGSYNNLVEGRELWGASGQPFPLLSGTRVYSNDSDGDSITFGAGTQGATTYNNTNYGLPGNVVDADPRIISNLIVDQTLNNPAAVQAALKYAGLEGAELATVQATILASHASVIEAQQLVDALGGPGEESALATAEGILAARQMDLETLLDANGVVMEGDTVLIPNVAPDEGLSAPFNSWFTLFGQFFDHGLDLVEKGGNGTVYIPLQPDDPLYQAGSPTNFMVLTRISGEDAANVTTPWVDQNQTYTSHASHQVFLREYVLLDGKPVATGHLLEGADGGLATWADVKKQAREMLGIDLTDDFVGSVPLVKTDPYGKFIPGPDGLPQVVFMVETAPGSGILVEELRSGTLAGTLPGPLDITGAARIANAFLDDIANSAVPGTLFDHDNNPMTAMIEVGADADDVTGNGIGRDARGNKVAYDNELLDAHFVSGDGRGNENIGLTAVHHVFHSEHNHLVEQVKDVVLTTGDLAFINEWLLAPVTAVPTDAATLTWNGERLFQAARFTNEMEYQHLVFEEFARKVQPDVDVFIVQPNVELDPSIFAEFAHVVYRFGHSMLNEPVDRVGVDGVDHSLSLIEAFLNPLEFNKLGTATVTAEEGAGAIVRGMTAQVGNAIDEFVTDALRNNLLGLPLDLATINLARGRETGMPTLNEARAQFKELAGGDTQLNPYTSWADFALNIQNSASIVNFIAAYGTHETITLAATVDAKRDAALKLVMGGTGAPADRLAFLNATGEYAGGSLGGLNNVDLWIGGLAEKKMPFGGMLGTTFSFVFELQMENLQNADRMYYLSRTQGMNLLTELENNSLAKMVMRNTDLGESGFALPGDIFSTPDHVFYVDAAKQAMFGHADPVHDDPILGAVSSLVERGENFVKYNGLDHTVIAGTDGNDTIFGGGGDDAIWGFDGDDRIEVGDGVDMAMGGAGDDIITNVGSPVGETDVLKGDEGNDVIHGGSGLSLIFGGSGQDAIFLGPDGSEARAGRDNDFILGREGADIIFGNEGDDWIEAGGGADYMAGDNGDLFFNSPIIGHDVLNGGSGDTDYDADSGDDIMFASEGIQKFIGMWGFDWVIHKDQLTSANADMNVTIFPDLPEEVLRDRFSQVEGLSGWNLDDVLRGDDRSFEVDVANDPTPEGNFIFSELTLDGIARIKGLDQIITTDLLNTISVVNPETLLPSGDTILGFAAGNVILGGGGSDIIEGRGGDDIIDGDAWLNVQIRVQVGATPNDALDTFHDSLDELQDPLLNGELNPSKLSIERRVEYADPYSFNPETGAWSGAIDVAVYTEARENYTITANNDGSWTVAHTGGSGVDGTDRLRNIEVLEFAGSERFALVTMPPPVVDPPVVPPVVDPPVVPPVVDPPVVPPVELVPQMMAALSIPANTTPVFTPVTPYVYAGPVAGLQYQLFGTDGHDIVVGTAGNDFINLRGGMDAANGGDGNDVIDGGTGSNFLTGGAGNDVFFLDGRGGGPATWSTITDWEAGDQLTVWGWTPTSTLTWEESAGAVGFEGLTLHGDLDSDGRVDVSVTWTGLSDVTQLPTPVGFGNEGLLWFT
jgi:Ca2+-binding RTX toxin-like protein